MNKEKGITLIALVITIIILLILLTSTIHLSIDSYKQAKVIKYVTMMQALQSKVDLLVERDISDVEWKTLGSVVSEEQRVKFNRAYNNSEITTEYTDINNPSYRYFSIENIKEQLGLDDITEDVIINIDTREIVGMQGIEYEGGIYYTQYKLPGGETIKKQVINVRELPTISLDYKIDGINALIEVRGVDITNCKLEYKLMSETNWNNIASFTEKGKNYQVTVSKSGEYKFRLVDNTNLENLRECKCKIILANAPQNEGNIKFNNNSYDYGKSSEYWAYAQDISSPVMKQFVWVPRFIYKVNGEGTIIEQKFMIGNSNIATDGTYIDKSDFTWILPVIFNDGSGGKTGVWKEVPSNNQPLNLIDLVNQSENN